MIELRDWLMISEDIVREGEVRMGREGEQPFVIKLEEEAGSPLDVEGIDLGLTAHEIVQFIRESGRMCRDSVEKDCEDADDPRLYELCNEYDLSTLPIMPKGRYAPERQAGMRKAQDKE